MKTVSQLFSERVYIIPQYQREYSWEVDNCVDMITDMALMPGELEYHYMGAIMLSSREETIFDSNEARHDVFEIVDGQQRLTTIILLLLAIQSDLKAPLPKLATSVFETYLRK